jgi:hypothetical protein
MANNLREALKTRKSKTKTKTGGNKKRTKKCKK